MALDRRQNSALMVTVSNHTYACSNVSTGMANPGLSSVITGQAYICSTVPTEIAAPDPNSATTKIPASTTATVTTNMTTIPDSVTSTAAPKITTPGIPQGLQCNGIGENKFLGRDELNIQIGKFCAEAAQQKVHDQDSGSISRIYNKGSRYEVLLGIDFPQGVNISENMEGNCKANMSTIMDSCESTPTNNPLNWKHGGVLGTGQVRYGIYPKIDQGYQHGQCIVHLQEVEDIRPNTPLSIQSLTIKDGGANTVGKLGFKDDGISSDPVGVFWYNPLNVTSALPLVLVIMSGSVNGQGYLRFIYSVQSWATDTKEGSNTNSWCDVGGWTQGSPRVRDMDCHFEC